ncbi:hypothetical protein N780_08575 [Pontibacillus chungwhensis BH030062]|uniref:Uncharacterized protein n=1 Tax=Pontibacillus chungwhensis BH030062 TaxID=1385513 RepID=A0A0A2UTK9_9BACI|nr:hypothetical protein [Pontibacillus chungwhensis]KGP91254.1 hypothetical protein N780_08575 [Pontibacillus chungwhensis BH030062]
MKWEELSKQKAEFIMSGWNGFPKVNEKSNDLNLRSELMAAFEDTLSFLEINKEDLIKGNYRFDMEYGLKVYQIFNQYPSFNVRTASNNNVWRYLSLEVIPDIVYYRWGMREGRFWKDPRRIWLKAIWWYIHLSWQGSEEATREVLKSNTTDDIVQLVERAGSLGYRVTLTREIIRHYGSLTKEQKGRNNQIFRKVMKLNTARAKTVEPDLHPGGQQSYVKELFDYFENAREEVKSS